MMDTETIKKELKIQDTPYKKPLRWAGMLLALTAMVIAINVMLKPDDVKTVIYQTKTVSYGDIRTTVSATGTLQPTNEVDVGSELSGTIEKVLVDYNDKVTQGQLLAQLNTDKLSAQILQAKANLQVAVAGVHEAEAALEDANANYNRLVNMRKISENQLPSEAELITALATKNKALAAKEAALAQVSQAQASLEQNQTEIAKAQIHSPINGIVLIRSIEEGQTVAATMSAPVLFTLAEDLTQMELQVDVDEADVGQVQAGQPATFTVDAYPNIEFPAVIKQVRFGAETTSGVVTYKTLLAVENPDLKLRPGMTATSEILVKNKEDVLLIPLSALRFTPSLIDSGEEESDTSIIDSLTPGPPKSNNKIIKKQKSEDGYQTIWRLVDNTPEAVKIKTGDISVDSAEVLEGDIQEGDEVIIGVEVPLK